MQWFANFIIANITGKFDGSQNLRLANYTRYTVALINFSDNTQSQSLLQVRIYVIL